MPRVDIDVTMHQSPFYALKAMGTDDLVFGSDDTLWQLRHDPLRTIDLDTDYFGDIEDTLEIEDTYT